jgi:DNA-binding transcriptional regulator YiaG
MLPHCDDHAGIIREVRSRLGLTQEKFAAKLGVTLPTINRWENGRASPSPLAMRNLRELIHRMGDDGKDLIEWFGSEDVPV